MVINPQLKCPKGPFNHDKCPAVRSHMVITVFLLACKNKKSGRCAYTGPVEILVSVSVLECIVKVPRFSAFPFRKTPSLLQRIISGKAG